MKQKLYLVRHAIAEDRDIFKASGLTDELRPLTAKGKFKMRKLASWLQDQIEGQLDFAIESPLLRSKQTLDILLEVVTPHCRLELSLLDPSSPVELLMEKLLSLKGQNILCVGHEPQLSNLIALLLGFDAKLQNPFKFKKGGMACLSFSTIEGKFKIHLEWLVAPKIILSHQKK